MTEIESKKQEIIEDCQDIIEMLGSEIPLEIVEEVARNTTHVVLMLYDYLKGKKTTQ